MAISGIGAGGISPIEFPKINTGGKAADEGQDFGGKLGAALQGVQDGQNAADKLAVQAATGDLTDVHDYMIAANKASVATQLTVAVKNKAVESFNTIMNMQV